MPGRYPNTGSLANFSQWYHKDPTDIWAPHHKTNNSAPAKDAYDEAVRIFSITFRKADEKILLQNHTTLSDVIATVESLKAVYESKTLKSEKLQQYLRKFSSRITYYGTVLDVMVQHHPEYASLAWGTMKFLFQGVMNHEELVIQLAKGITKIADALPRMELRAILYPTAQMKHLIQTLYAHIIKFLLRAVKWYQQPTWKRAVSSITEPFALHFKDILEDISEQSRQIDQLAVAASQAELRDMHIMVASMKTLLVDEISPGIRDLQLSSALDFVSRTRYIDPEASLRYCKLLSNRRSEPRRYLVDAQFLSTLRGWVTVNTSSTMVIKGAGIRVPAQCRDFGADLIHCAKRPTIPLIWALEAAPGNDDRERISSAVDLLKYLVFQILKLNSNIMPRNVNASILRTASTEAEWFNLLTALLSTLPRVIIVVDASLIGERFSDDISWIDAFVRVFEDLRIIRNSATIVKVVLLNFDTTDARASDFTLLNLRTAKGRGRAWNGSPRGNAAVNRRRAQRGLRTTLRGIN
ncbi:hypothetical protein TWF192_007917 [Orbilia oligospora]|uniref:DUF7708 domain-containing protein n=1 Tax=Orbilia oligospora TaxID=2813651 RepID=A0A6G1M467_ORBOL|nr:hypothetical protein TWF191_003044 [Orbilia oligospora]KAF3243850.1 hypothetical protein TWF192_007917 [Orbilia oligospora]